PEYFTVGMQRDRRSRACSCLYDWGVSVISARFVIARVVGARRPYRPEAFERRSASAGGGAAADDLGRPVVPQHRGHLGGDAQEGLGRGDVLDLVVPQAVEHVLDVDV